MPLSSQYRRHVNAKRPDIQNNRVCFERPACGLSKGLFHREGDALNP